MTERTLKPGWKTYRFDQIATNLVERVDPNETHLERYVGLEHLDSETLKIQRWGTPGDVIGEKLHFWKGDIILGRRRVYQRKLAVADFEGICSAHAMVLRAKPEVVLPDFLPFFMQSDLFMNRALEISVGSLSPTINWRTMAEQEFPLPPLEEQRRIAKRLLAIDNVIEATKNVLIDKTEVEKALVNHFITYGLQAKNLKYSVHFGSVPDHWQEIELGRLCINITDGEHITPPKTNKGIYLLSARNILDGKFDFTTVDFTDYETYFRFVKRVA